MQTPLARATRLAKAVAHPARIRILAMLASGELCVCQLTAVLDLAPSTVSAHLAELRRSGLVLEEKRAKFVFYSQAPDPLSRRWCEVAVAGLATDPAVSSDLSLVARIRLVNVEEFAASGSNLTLLPVLPEQPKKRAAGGGVRGTGPSRRSRPTR